MILHNNTNYPILSCGVDEAGRGPLAGSVFAAAVILNPNKPIIGLNDSKKLTSNAREKLYEIIIENAISYAIASIPASKIDEINILQATLLAMQNAINQLNPMAEFALIDGNKTPKLTIASQAIIKGDSLIPSISAASILAKVSRDNELIRLDKLYPEYGFAQHKGYGTKSHLDALNKYGRIDGIHRMSFSPVKNTPQKLINK